MTVQDVKTTLVFYKKLVEKIRENLKIAPQGSLQISIQKSGAFSFFQYFSRTEKSYLYPNDEKLIKALAQKDYDLQVLSFSEKMISYLEKCQAKYPDSSVEDIFNELHPQRKRLVEPYVLPNELFVSRWKSTKYQGYGFKEDETSYLTKRGERVRSKSEMIIANHLAAKGIPYRYEFPYSMDGLGNVCPDFTVLNPRTHKEYILEHFGLLDDPSYRTQALKKLKVYLANGYDAFFTFEPLDPTYLENLINRHFC